MTKRAAEEMHPSLESMRTGPDFFGCYRAQVESLLSQEEMFPKHNREASTSKASTEIIGAELSYLKTESLNLLLRECLLNSIPEVDEMKSRIDSVIMMSQLNNKKRSTASTSSEAVVPEDPTFEKMEDDMKLLMNSDPSHVKEVVSKQSTDLTVRLNYMQHQLEKILDNVVTTCRPMTREERRELKKSIRELPKENIGRIARIIKTHYVALGKEIPKEILLDLDEEDNVLVWRLYYSVAVAKSARELSRAK